MKLRLARLGALLWLLLAALLLGAGWRLLGSGLPLQTNLLALLPATERNPAAEEAVTRLARVAGDRAVFLIGHTDPVQAAEAARSLAAQLRTSGAFGPVLAEVPPLDPRQLTALYREHRFHLLTTTDRQALAAGQIALAARLQQRLYAPFQFGLSLPLADDPFGFTQNWLAGLPLRSLQLELDNGLLVRHTAQASWVFVSAELPGSAYDSHVANAAVSAVERARAELQAAHPQLQFLHTGAVFYADAARKSGEREVDVIGAGSLLGMLALLYLVFRSLRPLLLGLFSVGFGIAAAIIGVVALHGELHLITLVFGASLIGEAIDYSVQYFAAHLGAGQDWQPLAGLRRIAPGLTVALATSLLGYLVLMLAPFPALRQIALFAVIGLTAAWLTVFLLLPNFLQRPNARNPDAAVAAPRRFLGAWQAYITPTRCRRLLLAIPLLALPGWLQLHSDDDIRQLISRPPALVAEENRIRELIGFGNSSQFFIVEGATPDAVLAATETLGERLASLRTQGVISGCQSLADFVPSLAQQQENRRLWQQIVFADTQRLGRVLADAGLRDDVAPALRTAFAAQTEPLTLARWLETPMSTPYRHLWLGQTAHGYAAIVLPQGVTDAAALSHAADGLHAVTYVDKAGSISQLFAAYRQWGSLWLCGALLLVLLVLKLRYAWRDCLLLLTPTLLAIGVTLGMFGYAGMALTLFHLMGMMLVLGIGVNYSIFLREGGVNAAATLAGVALSAGTTLLSFGLLAFSSMPALSGFGLTLLLGIGVAVLLAPLSLSFGEVRT